MTKVTQSCLGLLGARLRLQRFSQTIAIENKVFGLLCSRSYSDGNPIGNTYGKEFLRSVEEPEEFWAKAAEDISWTKKWNKVLDNSNEPFTKWFEGGELNVSYNCIDRHVENGLGSRIALIHDSPVTDSKTKITYNDLLKEVSLFSGALAKLGVKKGDRVLIYMPMIPQAIVAMLAAARIGAIHCLVFGGFSSKELASRIEHAKPKVIVAASHGIEGKRTVKYKPLVDDAVAMCQHKPHKIVVYQRNDLVNVSLNQPVDVDYDELMCSARPHDPVPVEAMHPLYLLYTSGTTGQPKAVVRPSGGHAVNLMWTMPNVYGMAKNDIYWAASDLGWVVGHSYICYAPLLYGITSVVFEGKPVGTPNPGTYFRVISEHGVNGMFVAPTAMRAVRKEDSEGKWIKKYDLSSLKYFFLAGEHCDSDTLEWIKRMLNVPVLDNWWQTESGSPMTASCVGLGNNLIPPKDASGMPVPGWNVKVLNPDNTEAEKGDLGRIVCKLPLPPGSFSTLYKADERFEDVYFKEYPGYYDTMDAGMVTDDGYVCVMGRDDDVINVAGHRLSSSALEEAIMEHKSVAECAVVGVPDSVKGEIPLGLYIPKDGKMEDVAKIQEEIVALVRKNVGPVASFKLVTTVAGLPKTRSGKIARKTISDLAKNKKIKIPSTIEDAGVYESIHKSLKSLGYALDAPDPCETEQV